MKKIHILLPMLAMMLSFWSIPTSAQNESNEDNKIVIIKKSIDENGVETIEKTIKEGTDVNVLNWGEEDGNTIHIEMNGDDGAKSFSWKGDIEDMDELKEALAEMKEELSIEGDENLFFNFSEDSQFNFCDKNGQPFLGVVMKRND